MLLKTDIATLLITNWFIVEIHILLKYKFCTVLHWKIIYKKSM